MTPLYPSKKPKFPIKVTRKTKSFVAFTMNQRKVREFERLLVRTEKLEDYDRIKENMTIIEQRLSELRNEGLINFEQDTDYSNTLALINKRYTQKREKPKTRKTQNYTIDDEAKVLHEERKKHTELTNEYLKLTESLKESVGKIGVEMRKDRETVSTVHDMMDKTLNSAEDAQDDLDERSKERLGLKAWIWLIKVIVVFALMQLIFL